MTDAQRYLFDLQGFVVLRGVVPPSAIADANAVLERLEATPTPQLPPGVVPGTPRTPSEDYLSNVLEADARLDVFIDLPAVLAVINEVTGGLYRLNHAYSLTRRERGVTHLHMGGTPIVDQATYLCRGSRIHSPLTKAVFPLLPCGVDDGCFAIIPGSHKSEFRRPWSDHPEANPPLVPIVADPGDAIVFCEATTHGSMVNRSGRLRRTLYFCYSHAWTTDWGAQSLRFTKSLLARLPPGRRAVLELRDGSGMAPVRDLAHGSSGHDERRAGRNDAG